MLSMENHRVDPKEKKFLKSASLEYRLYHIICTYNEGWLEFYSYVYNALQKELATPLSKYLEHKNKIRRCQSGEKSIL